MTSAGEERGLTELRVVVDTASGLAPWRQVYDQLTALVDGGALATGTRLPAIRRLARDLGVAPGTVARAYRELEGDGRVRTSRGGGTAVVGPGAGPPVEVRLRAAARDYLAVARALGADDDAALDAVRALTTAGPP